MSSAMHTDRTITASRSIGRRERRCQASPRRNEFRAALPPLPRRPGGPPGPRRRALALELQAKLWGLASLPEVDLAQVQPSAKVEVSTAAFPNQRFSGRV